MKETLDSGDVGPSEKRYRVTHTHRHKTLKLGDIVRVACASGYDGGGDSTNCLVREADFTAHPIRGESRQYAHLEEVAEPVVDCR